MTNSQYYYERRYHSSSRQAEILYCQECEDPIDLNHPEDTDPSKSSCDNNNNNDRSRPFFCGQCEDALCFTCAKVGSCARCEQQQQLDAPQKDSSSPQHHLPLPDMPTCCSGCRQTCLECHDTFHSLCWREHHCPQQEQPPEDCKTQQPQDIATLTTAPTEEDDEDEDEELQHWNSNYLIKQQPTNQEPFHQQEQKSPLSNKITQSLTISPLQKLTSSPDAKVATHQTLVVVSRVHENEVETLDTTHYENDDDSPLESPALVESSSDDDDDNDDDDLASQLTAQAQRHEMVDCSIETETHQDSTCWLVFWDQLLLPLQKENSRHHAYVSSLSWS